MRKNVSRSFKCMLAMALLFGGVAAHAVTPMINAGNASSIFLNSDGSVWGTGSVTSYSPGATSPVRLLSLSNVVAVATGLADYALLRDGTVWASGSYNNYGQLGDGTTQPHSDPRQVPGLSNVRDIKAGGHVLALKADGTVWAWGMNAQGQLGDGTKIDRYSPVQVTGLSDVTQISASTVSSLALKSDGTVWEWGLSWGDSEGGHLVPSQVSNLDRVLTISAGPENNMAMRADGTVWAWGSNNSGQLGDGSFVPQLLPVQVPGLSDVVAIDARGRRSSIALKADGSIWAWGNNNVGQLGVSVITYSTTPIQVPGLSDIVTIAAGYTHVLAMRRDGTIFAWGDNSSGEIGDGTLQNRAEPRPVLGPGGSGQLNLVQPAPANPNQLPSATIEVNPPSGRAPLSVNLIAHANDPDGSVTAYYWQASDGQQATGPSATFVFSLAGSYTVTLLVEDNAGGRGGASVLVVVAQPLGAATPADPKVGIHLSNGMALANDGRILSWGYDGRLGRPPQPGVFGHMIPVPSANGITGAVDIAMSGEGSAFVLLADGSILGWGENDKGQVGVGSQAFVVGQPQSLTNLPPVQAMTAGREHALALTRDGKVFGWGRNAEGQLGLGDNANRSSPVEIPGLSNIIAIAAGFNFSMALTADGAVWIWGENTTYTLGDGTQLSRNRPVQVPGLASIQKIFATGANGVAINADGAVWASGFLPFSFAGEVRFNPPSVFRRVPLLDGAVQLAGGGQHILFRKADGTVWVVGMRASLALGVEGTGDINVPQQVPGITDAIWVAGITNNSMVLRGDGTVLAWGRNASGQLGDGTLAQRVVPVAVVNEKADGFLDLIPEMPNVPYSGAAQPFFSKAVSDSAIVDAKPTITNTTKFNAADVGKSGAVYVSGAVPRGTLTSAPASKLSALNQLRPSALVGITPAPFVLVQLTPSGWQEMVNGQLLPYASGVLGDQLAAQTILSNTDTTNLKGAQFCVGYGTSAEEMIATARMKTVVTIPDPDATGASTVSCIVQSASVAASDSDGDRKSDILWRNTNGQVAIWLMNGMAPSSGAIIATVGNEWKIAASGDFDGDGKSDILWRNTNGQVAMWLMSGMAQESSAIIAAVSTDWTIAATGDFDGDRKSDILWRNTNGQAAIWLMNGMAQKSSAVIAVVGNEWKIAASGDFDGDGKRDILWRNTNGQVAIWLMNGMAQKSSAIIAAVSTDWTIAGTGDFSGDGKSDIMWRNINGEAAIWLMNGMAQQSAGSLGVISNDWKITGAGDFDGDGKSDILWRNDNGQVAIWLINGAAQKSSALLGLVSTDWGIASGAPN